MSNLFSGLASITKTVSDALNNPEVKKFQDQVTGYVMNFTDAEIKVRNATNDEGWGPTNQQCDEISSMTYQYDLCTEACEMLFKRMMENTKGTWRRTYKSLRLVDYCLKNGSERFIKFTREHSHQIRGLQNFHYIDERGKDQGINIRVKAKAIMALLQDEDVLFEERKKAKTTNKDKYVGYSKEDIIHMSGSSSTSGFGNDFYNKNTSSISDFKKSQSMNDNMNKEVNSFNFPEDKDIDHTELGIPDTPHNDDDDFGEFASPIKVQEPKKKVEVDLFCNIAPLAPPPGGFVSPTFSSPRAKVNNDSPKQQVANDLIDLMDGFTVSQPPADTYVNVFAATRFDSESTTSPNKNQPTTVVNNLLDLDFNIPEVKENKSTQDEFADFESFTNSVKTTNSSTFDFFNTQQEYPNKKISVVAGESAFQNNEEDFGEFGTPEEKTKSKESKKLGSTWNGLEDKFGLDFANFNLKKGETDKKKVSMNEMKSKTNMSTTNFF
uniref:ENTH domain-containing protein n=1 Tax=Parastrongyloides trichosuri TaxID=131310 RepID=A0A0N5A451_PARTI